MLEVCSEVTNENEKDGGYKRSGRTLVRGAESDESSAMCYVLCVRACARGLNLVVLLLCTSELDPSNKSESTESFGRKRKPFYR